MNLYKQLGLIVLLVCLAGTAFAVDIPSFGDLEEILDQISNGTWGAIEQDFLDELLDAWENGQLDDYKERILDELLVLWENGDLYQFKDLILGEIKDDILNYLINTYASAFTNPKELIRGFANASVYASHSATHRAFGDYNEFAFSIGAMAGFRLPGGILTPVKDLMNAGNKFIDDRDIRAGVNVQAVNSQFGLNTSLFLLDGLYLGIRYTYLRSYDIQGFSLRSSTLGIAAHYQLIKAMDGGNGWHRAFRWRGLTVGTGFLYSSTTLTGGIELDDLGTYGFTAGKPKMNLDINVTTYTVPLEMYSSALMLWFINVHLGLGVDIAFGKSTSSLGLTTTIRYEDQELGDIDASGGGTMSPSLLNPKITAGIGFKMGIVILDVPISYYIYKKGSGLSMGITLGIAL